MVHRPYSDKIWFSPCYVINELSKSVLSRNQKIIDKNKEAWICAVALLCRSKTEPAEWWIQVPKKDPPDVLAMNIIPHKNGLGNSMSVLPVEVFEISEYDKETIQESIERKLMGLNGLKIKDYSDTMVVGFMRRKEVFDHVAVADYIKKVKHNAAVVYLIVSEENNTNLSILGVFPDCFKYKCDWGLVCKNTTQRDFVEMERGTKVKKSDNTTSDILALIPGDRG